MRALDELEKNQSIDRSVTDTGLRAYTRVRDQRLNDREPPRQLQQSAFDQIDARVAEAIEKQRVTLDQIRKEFVLRDDRAVITFLRAHRTVPSLLIDAVPELNKNFGDGTVYILDVLTEEDGSREIYVVVEWPGDARSAMKALDNLVENWWIERSAIASGRLHFTYELK